MLVTLDIKNESMKESFLNFVKRLDYIDIKEEAPFNRCCSAAVLTFISY